MSKMSKMKTAKSTPAKKGAAKASKDAQAAIKEAQNLKEVEKKITNALAKVKLKDSVKFTIDSSIGTSTIWPSPVFSRCA